MKKILPLLITTLIIVTAILLNRFGLNDLDLTSLTIKYIKGGSITLETGDISLLGIVILSAIIFIKAETSIMFYVSYWVVICGIILKKYILDIVINIKSLSWFPEISISYLTVAIGSMIIILSLIIESRSIDE